MSQYYGLVGGTVPRIGAVSPGWPTGIPLGASQGPTDLKPGDSFYMFGTVPAANAGGADDALVVGEEVGGAALPTPLYASVPICITPPAQGGPPPMVCFEIGFDGAPGVFELDIQEADTDADAFYITPTNAAYTVTAVVAATNKARVDLQPTGGKFMRVLLKTLTNDVEITVKATRLA